MNGRLLNKDKWLKPKDSDYYIEIDNNTKRLGKNHIKRSHGYCSCGKVMYNDKPSAFNAKKLLSNRRVKLEVYLCDICNCYHIGRKLKNKHKDEK